MFPNLDTVEVKEQVSYLPAGIHQVSVVGMSNSNQKQGYTGTPYVEFKVSNDEGISNLRFSGVEKDVTSENAARVRTEIFKGFLQSAGAKSFNNLPIACKEVLGSKITVCLREREYWTNDKETGAPVVKKMVEYKFASTAGKNITWKDSYNKTLSETDQTSYQAAHDAFIGSNSVVADDSMPF